MKQKKTFHLSLRRTWQLMTGGLSVVTLAALCWALCLSATLPDRYYLAKGSRFSLGDSSLIQTSSNDGYPLSVYSSTGNTFRMDLKLLGLINIKPVSVQVVDRRVVALCGTPFGIKMVTDGVMVVGTGAVTDCNSRAVSPAQTAGIQEGDIILSINGEKISSKKQLTKLVESSAGQPLSLVVRRGEQLTSLHLSPVRSSLDNSYHLGLWVRDSSAGIGTMTFYDPNNGCRSGTRHLRRGHRSADAAFTRGDRGGFHHRCTRRKIGQSRTATGCLCCQPFHRFSVHKQLQRCLRTADEPAGRRADHSDGTVSGGAAGTGQDFDHRIRAKAAAV